MGTGLCVNQFGDKCHTFYSSAFGSSSVLGNHSESHSIRPEVTDQIITRYRGGMANLRMFYRVTQAVKEG